MKKHFIRVLPAVATVWLMASCADGKQAEALENASAVADKMISADYDHNVEVNSEGNGLDVAIRLSDSLINVEQIGPELFNALAAMNLRTYSADDVNTVVDALRKAKGDVTVELITPDKTNCEYSLTASQLVKLRSAKLTQLNPALLKAQIIDVANGLFPGGIPEGAEGVETSIVKSFLEYDVQWPSATAYANREQGWLTLNYFNAFKRLYAQLDEACPGLVAMLADLGIDGVRVAYTAPDSERAIRQAFPWRELEKPIEDFPIVKTK